MIEVRDLVRRFAACDLPVLITGESGTGKELAARAIHQESRRSTGPSVAVNCAALPASLIASELFGYEKGAFTGAATQRFGHIEHARGGTLVLDELGDMPLDLQGYLLRFLQEGEIVRVGGRKPIKVDARIITATNIPLRAAIAAGQLREDLFYRLNVLTLHMPALRDRAGDAEMLATQLLHKVARELGRSTPGITSNAMAAIRAYSWPGNVRELVAALRRAVVLATGPMIEAADLRLEPVAPKAVPPSPEARPVAGSSAERDAVLGALVRHRQNITQAAAAIGVSRVTFYRMLRRIQTDAAPGLIP